MVAHHQPGVLGRLQPRRAPRAARGRRDPHGVPGGGGLVAGRGRRHPPRQPATINVDGGGDLAAAADQVRRFLSLDVDAPGVADVARGMGDAGDERDVSDRSGSPRGIG